MSWARLLGGLLLAVLLATPPALALDASEQLDDPALEERARGLSAQLRCLVCQNQSIDDSDAPLAQDLRRLVRERLVAGDEDEQVIAFLVARYGDFVLLSPPVQANTLILWYGPAVLLLVGAIVTFFVFRRAARAPATATPALDGAEEARLAALLAEDREERRP